MSTPALIEELEKTAAELEAAADKHEAEKVAAAKESAINPDFIGGMARALGLK